MRLGGATGAPPASRSKHHDRRSPLQPQCFAIWVPGACGSHPGPRPTLRWRDLDMASRLRPPDAARAPVAPPPSRLSRWLLALGNSDVPPRANVPPLRDHERQSRNQHLATSNALPLRAVEYAFPIPTSAPHPARQAPLNPGLSRRLLPLAPHRTPHRFATTPARRETNAGTTTSVPGSLRSGGGRQGACQQPPFPLAAVTHPANRPPPCHFAPEKTKSDETTPSGCRQSWVFLRVQCCPRPSHAVDALSSKSVREHLQRGWAARRWHPLVGVRWQRFQCRVAAFYFQRVSLPVQWWRAAGCPPQFRPRLPWWQPFVWRWLVLSGWLPARRQRPPWAAE
jgi:hypothetical protein